MHKSQLGAMHTGLHCFKHAVSPWVVPPADVKAAEHDAKVVKGHPKRVVPVVFHQTQASASTTCPQRRMIPPIPSPLLRGKKRNIETLRYSRYCIPKVRACIFFHTFFPSVRDSKEGSCLKGGKSKAAQAFLSKNKPRDPLVDSLA